MRLALIAALAFIVGASIALVARAAFHQPYAAETAAEPTAAERELHDGHQAPPPAVEDSGAHEGHGEHQHGAEVPAPSADAHAGHGGVPPAHPLTVNSICPVCGMDVDPSLGIWHWEGQPIGIGCRACVSRMEKELERYGPAALENRKLGR